MLCQLSRKKTDPNELLHCRNYPQESRQGEFSPVPAQGSSRYLLLSAAVFQHVLQPFPPAARDGQCAPGRALSRTVQPSLSPNSSLAVGSGGSRALLVGVIHERNANRLVFQINTDLSDSSSRGCHCLRKCFSWLKCPKLIVKGTVQYGCLNTLKYVLVGVNWVYK